MTSISLKKLAISCQKFGFSYPFWWQSLAATDAPQHKYLSHQVTIIIFKHSPFLLSTSIHPLGLRSSSDFEIRLNCLGKVTKTDADRWRKGGWSTWLPPTPDSFTMANCCIRFSFSFLNAISTHSHVCLCHLHATIDAVAVAVGDAVAPWISSCFRTMLLLFLLLLLVVVVLLLASFLQHCSIRTPILRLFSNSLRCLLSLGILLLLVAHPFPYQDSPAPPTQLLPHRKLPLIHFPQLLQATWKLGKVGETTHYHTIPPHSRLLS